MIILGNDIEINSTGEKIVLSAERDFKTQANEVLYFVFERPKLELYRSLVLQEVKLAIHIADIKELILVCNLGAKYAVANKEDSAIMQKAVDNYLFDTRLLAFIDREEEIEWAAINEIDGVVFYSEMFEV